MATRRPARGGPGWLVPTVLLFVVAPVAFAVTTAVRGDGGESGDAERATSTRFPRTGSTPVAGIGKADPLAILRTPSSYEITYLVTTGRTPDLTTSKERIQVQRPFQGRVTNTPPGGGPDSIRATRLGALVIPTGSGSRRLSVPPAMAGSDLRFDVALPIALADNRVAAREQRRVVNRRCQVYRFGGSIIAGDLTPYVPDGPEWTDACIDEDGLVLEELWHKDGRDLRHRVATAVRIDVPLGEELFTLPGEESIPSADGNGVFRRLAAGSSVAGPVRAILPPAGFEPLGRFAVQPPRLDAGRGPTPEQLVPESFDQVDVWRRGPDLLVLTTTIAADASTPGTPPEGSAVDLGPLGRGALALSLRGAIVTAPTEDGRTTRLSGTLPPDELVALLREATTFEGTGLQFDDGA